MVYFPQPRLEAGTYGVDVALCMIDDVEAAEETVKDGRYPLRRPLLLVSREEPNPVAEGFATFARSTEGPESVNEMFPPSSPPPADKSNSVKTESPQPTERNSVRTPRPSAVCRLPLNTPSPLTP